MHFIFAAMRLFPFWAIPVAMILWELAIYYRRKNHKYQYLCGALLVVMAISTVGWVVGRGDKNSDEWTRAVLGVRPLSPLTR